MGWSTLLEVKEGYREMCHFEALRGGIGHHNLVLESEMDLCTTPLAGSSQNPPLVQGGSASNAGRGGVEALNFGTSVYSDTPKNNHPTSPIIFSQSQPPSPNAVDIPSERKPLAAKIPILSNGRLCPGPNRFILEKLVFIHNAMPSFT